MKSKHSSNNYQQTNSTPLSKRRLKTKPVLTLLAILLFGNIFWFVLWAWPSSNQNGGGDEIVASIDGEEITRQDWMAAMERRYGKETLESLVNTAVMEKAAKAYDIEVSDKEIDLEIALLRSAQDSTDTTIQQLSNEELRQEIRSQLILDKVLTKDVVIDDAQMNKYYEENQSLYNIPTTYRTSLIVVQSKEDADRVLKELENGSDFSVLAREHSLDSSSASLGGDIGFITSSQSNLDSGILQVISELAANEVSKPFIMNDGTYGIAMVKEVNEGKSFTFEEVKERIGRVLALEQLPNTITPESFWKEFDASWSYGK